MRRDRRDQEFETFYQADAGRLHRLALLLTGEPERAADLAQESLLKAYASWHRIRGDDPGPYVRRILVNQFRNSARRSALERLRAPRTADVEPERTGSVDDSLAVRALLDNLSPIRRATVVLRYYEDLPEAEIARTLDRPLGTVKSDLHRALTALRPLAEAYRGES
ncbi:MAG: sigma-70 family RNA polymerase sigma factor [Actinomycetota bacterium]